MIRREDKSYSIFSFEKTDRIDIKNANRFKIKVFTGYISPKTTTVIIDLKGLEVHGYICCTDPGYSPEICMEKKEEVSAKKSVSRIQGIIDLLKLEKDFKIIDG